MKCAINSYELLIYYCVWTAAIILSIYKYIQSQKAIFEREPELSNKLEDLVPGWSFLGRDRDVSDIEWSCWKFYIKTTWLSLSFQFFVSESLRKHNNTIIVKCWFIISGLIFILFYYSWKHLFLILIQPVVFLTVLICGGKRTSIWLTGLILLSCYNTVKYKYYIWDFLDDVTKEDEEIFLVLFAIGWIELKCISFCIDYVENEEKVASEEKFREIGNLMKTCLNLFSYILYLPLLTVGPIILYEEYENSFQYKIESLFCRMKRFTLDIVLFGIYTFLLDFALHYVYFCALHSEMKYIKELSSVALSGGGLWMGFQFYVKYVISYGTSAAIARLDNIDAPPTPRCIARIHVYSQMWRYFDVGLYKFLVRYIYKPIYKMLTDRDYVHLSKTLCKMTASLFTFLFIFLWHGILMNIFIWSTLNYFSIVLEHFAKIISRTKVYENFKIKVLKTEAMEARFIACLCAPLLAVSAMSNFYLFGGTDVGNMYVGLMSWPAVHNVMIILLSTYCCSHISMALSDLRSRTDYRKTKTKIQ